MSPCLVCAEVRGDVAVPGGHLEDGELVMAFHSPIVEPATDVFLGYLFVTARRHVPGFADLTPEEAAAVGVSIARWSRALEAAGAEHVYLLRVGHRMPHLHVHLVPRWPETPDEVPWVHVDDWPGARRGAPEQAAALVSDLRRRDGQSATS
jgi:diadenosine tetraphosphate (Ap4A) HIT family hydrolase